MDFKAHLVTAWEQTLAFIAPLIIITLALFAVWFVSFGILAPVTLAGYTESLLRMLRDKRPPRVGDLFSCMNLFLPLLGFSILVVMAVMIGFVFLVLPGLLIGFFISFVCLFPTGFKNPVHCPDYSTAGHFIRFWPEEYHLRN